MAVIGGTEGNDTLFGGVQADFLIGLGGADNLRGGGGGDVLDGGAGVDQARYDDSPERVSVTLFSGSGTGGFAQGDTLVSIENLLGSAFNDNLQGDNGANVLDGGGGIDNIVGNRGDDILRGGGTLFGGDGRDTLTGAGDNDRLDGGTGDDLLVGGGGADLFLGGAGQDVASYDSSAAAVRINLLIGTAFGGDASGDRFDSIEVLIGSAFADQLTGDASDNRLTGLAGADILSGAGGRDTLDGGTGADFLFGNDGDDLLLASAGADTLSGGNGVDLASYAASAAGVTVTLSGGAGTGGLAAGDILTLVENLAGSAFADVLRGDTGANGLFGGAAGDRLEGGGGADVLDGGAGADSMAGGAGNDTYRIDAAGDRIDEAVAGSGGIDTVQARISFDLAGASLTGAVENLTLIGPGSLEGRGNGLANTIVGSTGANLIAGRGGNDILTGGLGADQFLFGTASAAAGVDTITDFSSAQDSILLESSVFTGLVSGPLAAGALRIGSRALDADDRIIYDPDSGALSFDRDGNGRVQAIDFAILDPDLTLSASDFLIV